MFKRGSLMKKSLSLILVVVCIFFFSSCRESDKLSKNIAGSSNPQTTNNSIPTIVANEKLILTKFIGPNRWEILSSDFFLTVFNEKGPSWLLLHSDMASGSEEKFLFITKNKGETWDYVGKMPSMGYVNGITFRNENEGWAGYEYYGNYMVPLYRTLDGGKTWDKQIINLPKGYRYGNVFTPSFDPNFDLKGSIKIDFARENSDVKDTFTYQTSNGGKSWENK
jgi:hypothetical protein